jgi:hypothetical protein
MDTVMDMDMDMDLSKGMELNIHTENVLVTKVADIEDNLCHDYITKYVN